jgi:hypothetical protein
MPEHIDIATKAYSYELNEYRILRNNGSVASVQAHGIHSDGKNNLVVWVEDDRGTTDTARSTEYPRVRRCVAQFKADDWQYWNMVRGTGHEA